MTVPAVLESRMQTALAAVDANTDLDLLISLIDAGQRAGVDISVAATEISRRAGLVDSNTSIIIAAKLTAALFKIDNPSPDLWTAASGGAGGSHQIGELVSGFFAGNSKYVPANGSRYLLAAYPDMTSILAAGGLPTYYEPVEIKPQVFVGSFTAVAWRETPMFVDGEVMFCAQQPGNAADSSLLAVTTDGGVTWRQSLPKSHFVSAIYPAAVAWGLSTSTNMHIVGVCKLDTPGHYAAALADSTGSANVYFIVTRDYGVTWGQWTRITGTSSMSTPWNTQLLYRNGAFLYVANDGAKYSIDDGDTWVTLTNATWTNTTTVGLYGSLSDDGFYTLADTTTSIKYFEWPATPAGWNANLPFTTATSKFVGQAQYVKKLGNYWVAWNTGTKDVYVSETLLGTYTANSVTAFSVIYDIVEKDGVFYFHGTVTNGLVYASATAALSFVSTISLIDIAPIPSLVNVSTLLRWPTPWRRFAVNIGATRQVIFRHGREGMARITSPTTVVDFSHIVPNSQYPGYCKKYGRWFCSIPKHDQAPTAASVNTSSWAYSVLHYSSADGLVWKPIGVGFSEIVDAGTRLLRLNRLGALEQSTDGLVWNTAEISQPSYVNTVAVARLWRVADVVYYFRGNSASSGASVGLFATLDGGVTWNSVTGLPSPINFAKAKSNVAKFKGEYFAFNPYISTNSNTVNETSVDSYTILRSSNGYQFTTALNNVISAGSYNLPKVLIAPIDDNLFISVGSTSGNAVYGTLITGDGRTFLSGSAHWLNALLGPAGNVDTYYGSGDFLLSVDRNLTVGATTLLANDVYVNGILRFTILQTLTTNQYVNGLTLTPDGECLAVTRMGQQRFNANSAAFMVPVPNSGTSPMPYPFMRVVG